ncbi:MAG: DUF3575 domain-containing protein [Prevotella sp.]|nr:DUF3575 domain-containing protein [Prevotella sp.]
MTFRHHTSNIFTSAIAKMTALVACLILNAFFVRAQSNDAQVRVFFPFDSPVLSESYMTNATTFQTLDALVAGIKDGSTVEVISYSSPEGNVSYNLNLSRNRAKSVVNFLEAKYPQLRGRIRTTSGAESWDDLRSQVSADSRLSASAKKSILSIIDGSDAPDAKESALKALPQYKALYSNYFRSLRFADISLRIENSAKVGDLAANSEFSESSANMTGRGLPIVYFPLSETTIHPEYMGNEANIAVLREMLSDPKRVPSRIVIEGAASPEGPLSINERLGANRARTLVNFLVAEFPYLKDRLVVRSVAEDWAGLRACILANGTLGENEKSELIGIIDSNNTPARKEALMKASASYPVVEKECLPYIRYARIGNIEFEKPATVEPVDTTPVDTTPKDTVNTVAPVDTTATPAAVDTTDLFHAKDTLNAIPAADTTATVKPFEGGIVPAFPAQFKGNRNMIAAVKTNLLYDAVTALNVEVEVPIANRFSVTWEDVFPWWETGNKYCFQLWEMGAEARYWFKPWETIGTEKLRGWFVGPYVMSGKYDFQYDKSINYQGEMWSVGATAGYAMPIGKKKRVNLEFSLSMGYMKTHFRHYIPTDSYDKLIHDPAGDGSFYNIFKYPTKAKVSLVVPISYGKKEARHE